MTTLNLERIKILDTKFLYLSWQEGDDLLYMIAFVCIEFFSWWTAILLMVFVVSSPLGVQDEGFLIPLGVFMIKILSKLRKLLWLLL